MPDRCEALIQVDDGRWLLLEDPVRIIEARHIEGVAAAIADVERLTRDAGYHAAGFVTYEAGAAFGLRVSPPHPDLPLVWFGLFEPQNVRQVEFPPDTGSYRLGDLTPSLTLPQFEAAFRRIKQCLADGDSYQVNFTFRMRADFRGDPRHLFVDLVEAQKGRYSAFVHLGRFSICSASPELFFAVTGLDVTARPMKGTAPRGRTLEEDRQKREQLHESPKQRAENVMIVDMVRNDLGRIADVGSVAVPELFIVERYPNVWQMTSLVTARSRAPLEDIFAAMHPSASVTGAPKSRTMEILSELEGEPRGVYTGAIGHVSPDGTARFSVAIRTALVDHRAGRVGFGVGSGIVWDSEPAAEYEECLLKGSVLGRPPVAFDLLETLRWTPEEGFYLLDRHVRRLADSAEYFGFPCRLDAALHALHGAVAGGNAPLRLRLLLARTGAVRVETEPLVASLGPLEVALAVEPIDSSDRYLFHKTTYRDVYDRARIPGYDDVVLWNGRGEITEATTANIVVQVDGELVTPPVACGLLPGTCRAELLDRGEIRESIVTVDQLRAASRCWLTNAVHGRREARLASELGRSRA
jgi:para-aminobenzoate synthetase/4-amino-4-deoxychorismate lyase